VKLTISPAQRAVDDGDRVSPTLRIFGLEVDPMGGGLQALPGQPRWERRFWWCHENKATRRGYFGNERQGAGGRHPEIPAQRGS